MPLITCNFGLRLLAEFGDLAAAEEAVDSTDRASCLILAAISGFCHGLSLSLSLSLSRRTRFYFLQDKTVVHKKATRDGPLPPLHFYGPHPAGRAGGREAASGVRSHLLRHCRDGHWMGMRWAWLGMGPPADFHPDLIFGRCPSSFVMFVASHAVL